MSQEKYMIEIEEGGSQGLERLEYCFNATTQEFLANSGLKSGMTVLDVGCGSGVMTCWIAEKVGSNGKVIAIENDENQLNAAKKRANKLGINNIEFQLCSVYEIESLKQQFDLVYCRFVLHHLHDPMLAIKKIFQILKPGGVYAAEEGIVNFAFPYPYTPAWGNDSINLPPVWTDAPIDQRDGNVGIKMFNKMHHAGFKILSTKICHPLLTTKEEKNLLLVGREEFKKNFLAEGRSEQEWEDEGKEIERIINDDTQIIGFYASCQTAGEKP